MFTRNSQADFIASFNALIGGANKRSSAKMDRLFDDLNKNFPELNSDQLTRFLLKQRETIGSNRIVDLIDFVALSKSLKADKAEEPEKEEVQEVEKTEEPKPAEVKTPEFKIPEEKMNALGVFEKAICSTVVDTVAPEILNSSLPMIDEFIRKTYGKVIRTVTYEFPKHNTSSEGTFHEKFEEVLAFVEADEPVLLTGPAGTGKNVICKQVAEAMGLEFYFSNAVTQEYKLTGFTDAHGNYQESQFYQAFTKGGVFMLDEMDASIPEVLIILNAAIANRYFDFPAPIGKVEANENFRVVAAANTFGTGADMTYTGRYQLDGASLDRFAVIEIGYSEIIENSITENTELLNFFREFRSATAKSGVDHICSYRALKRMDKMSNVLSKEQVVKTCLTKNLEGDDIRVILNSMNSGKGYEWYQAMKRLAYE